MDSAAYTNRTMTETVRSRLRAACSATSLIFVTARPWVISVGRRLVGAADAAGLGGRQGGPILLAGTAVVTAAVMEE